MNNLKASETIMLTQDGAVCTLTLNNPDLRNRLSTKDIETLINVIGDINSDTSVRALILTGTGSVFSSGFDLMELALQKESQSADVDEIPRPLFEQLTDQLEDLRCPSICALNGAVYGGAIDIALACDFRVAKPDLQISMPASRVGLHYYPNGIRRYVSRLGVAITKKLFLLGGSVSGDELAATSFVDFSTTIEEFDQTVSTLSTRLSAGGPLAIEGMKRAINWFAMHSEPDDKLLDDYWTALASEDFRRGLQMALEKKPANFQRN